MGESFLFVISYKIEQYKVIKWRPITYTILSFFKWCLEGRDDEYIIFFWPYHDRFWINRRGLTEGVLSGAIKKRLILIPTSPLPFHCDTLFEWNSCPPLWPDTRAFIGSCRIAFSIAFCCWWCCCCCCCFIITIIIITIIIISNA